LIAGIYGMNFQYMTQVQWVHGYPVALLSITFIDLCRFFRFREANWL
jgi:magnesium transporter